MYCPAPEVPIGRDLILVTVYSSVFPGGASDKKIRLTLQETKETCIGSPGGGNGSPLQDSCLENFMDRGVWWTKVHEVAKSQT